MVPGVQGRTAKPVRAGHHHGPWGLWAVGVACQDSPRIAKRYLVENGERVPSRDPDDRAAISGVGTREHAVGPGDVSDLPPP